MKSRINQKVIFPFFLFIIFIPQAKVSGIQKFKNNNNSSHFINNKFFKTQKNHTKLSSVLINDPTYISKLNSLNNDTGLSSNEINEKKEELVIESDVQSEINNILYADGNVNVIYKGKYLKADSLIYDKTSKKISAKGNVSLIFGEQFFIMDELEYNFISNKGSLKNVKGQINTGRFIDDIYGNFNDVDIKKIESLLSFKKKKVINTPRKIENWIFYADKLTIDNQKWKSKKAFISNDLLAVKQVKIQLNSLEAISNEEELRFKSGLNYLILDETVSIPIWFVDRSLNKSGESINYENEGWTVGYDNLDKDGLFIGRKFNFFDFPNDFVITLEPQYLIQRSIKGYTKSYVSKGDSITGDKVKRDTTLSDYFALQSKLKGKVENWNLKIEKQINSFDLNKFSDAFRFKTSLSKEINFLDSEWEQNFYGVYRDRVWNGSLGESEIYQGYGSKLEKKNTWEENGITKTEIFSIGLANINAEALDSKNLFTSVKANLFYSLDQRFPIIGKTPKNKLIDNSYEYIFEPISKGLSLNKRVAASYSLYEHEYHQEFLGLGLGPELIFGNFKNKIFDYTRVSIFPFYKFISGDSVFKFDQISDKFTLNLAFDQQLYGPLILQSSGTLNLDSDREDYGEFINSKIALNWKKRSFAFGIFYQPHNQSGGITFSLYGFK